MVLSAVHCCVGHVLRLTMICEILQAHLPDVQMVHFSSYTFHLGHNLEYMSCHLLNYKYRLFFLMLWISWMSFLLSYRIKVITPLSVVAHVPQGATHTLICPCVDLTSEREYLLNVDPSSHHWAFFHRWMSDSLFLWSTRVTQLLWITSGRAGMKGWS